MSQGAKDLDHLMLDGLQDGGYMVSGGRELFMEVIDTTTGRVWMSAAPVKMADFEALALEASQVKVGIARASMDRAAFQHSPGSPGKPVLQRIIDGRLYTNVAVPREQIPGSVPHGPMEISVDKAHLTCFEAGRTVYVQSLHEGAV